ncbi:MAG: hypothetical protein M1426_04015, partial [Patescibacteria group bacterium]|nr:hypothetical protein [Patescibacteria group bacterium]
MNSSGIKKSKKDSRRFTQLESTIEIGITALGKKEIQEKVDNIIRFAALRQFIDVPLYTYSSGMKLRLGFAV